MIENFKPCEDYLRLIEVSDQRKITLFGESAVTFGMSRLRSEINRKDPELEIHHKVPRYRLRDLPTRVQNSPENLMVLTPEEHILAHYYIMRFEVGKWVYSALMAFIQLTSLKKESLANFTEDSLKLILPEILLARKRYFRSDVHLNGSRKAGIIAGNIRKQRMEEDPSFAAYIKSRLHDDEVVARARASYKVGVNALPPWRRPGARKSTNQTQSWEHSNVVFAGIKLGFSYKKIANYLGISFTRISNMVRVLKKDFENLESFDEWKFYREYIRDFGNPVEVDIEDFLIFGTTPWKPNSDAWVHADFIFNNRFTITSPTDLTGITNQNSRDTLFKWVSDTDVMSLPKFEDWKYYKLWVLYREDIEDMHREKQKTCAHSFRCCKLCS